MPLVTQPNEKLSLRWSYFEVDSTIRYPKFTIYGYSKSECTSHVPPNMEQVHFHQSANSSCLRGDYGVTCATN